MTIIKKGMIAIAGIVVLLFIVALILPSDYHVTREITIAAPPDSVFNYLKYLKHQDEFSVWNQMDPHMKKTFRGVDGTVGAVAGWQSDNEDVGSGEQEIVHIEPGKRIDFELRFLEPWESQANAYFTTEAVDSNITRVTWGVLGTMPYPFNLLLVVMDMDDAMGKDLSRGLTNLKHILEH